MKYIQSIKHGFVIFQDHITHKQMADSLRLEKGDILSAGFVTLDDPQCYGKSASLGVASDPSDTDRLTRQTRGY